MDLEWWSKFHVILCLLVFTTFQKPLLCWRQTCTRILRNEDNEGGLCWSSWRQLKVSERLKFYEVLKSSEKSEMQKETAEALRSWSRNPRPTSSPCPSRSRPHPPMMSAAKMARAEKPTKKAPMRPEDQNGSKWIKVDQTRKTALRDGRDTERLSACFGTRCINCPSQVPAFLPKRQRRAGNSCRVCKSKEVQIWCWTFAGHLQNFSEKLVQQHEWQCPCRCHLQTQMNSSLEIMIKSVSGRCGSNSCSNYEHFMIILPSDSLTAILLHRYFECDLKCS